MDNKKKNILIAILIVGILTITVAFAALSSTLTIRSAATIKGGSWEVLFVSGTGPSAPTSAPASGRSAYFNGTPSLSATIIQNINAVLTQPGDTLTYNFKIRNNGSIDAKLDIINSVTPTCTPSGEDATTVCNNITRSLKYVSAATKVSGGGAGTSTMTADSPVAVGDVLKAGEEISVDLTISYASGTTTSSFPATDVTVSYPDQVLTYIQDDGETHGLGGNPIDEHDPVLNNYEYAGGQAETDEYITWDTELDSNLVAYLRKNTSTNEVETCEDFPNGTVCLTNNENGYGSDFEDAIDGTYTSANINNSGLKGYTLTKAQEMLSNGATECTVYLGSSTFMWCNGYDQEHMTHHRCSITQHDVYCYDGSIYECGILNDGRYYCRET